MAQILVFPQKQSRCLMPLDGLLEQGRITPQQHWCGVHLRWLHNVSLLGTGEARWLAARNEEYRRAIDLLNVSGHSDAAIRLCILDIHPVAIQSAMAALDVLESLWRGTGSAA